SVLLGNGDGTFQSASDQSATGWGTALAAADFNDDGRLDLATNYSVLLGNGDGTFGAALGYAGGWQRIATGDLDGDGRMGLVGIWPGGGMCDDYNCSYYPGYLGVLLGNGDGSFRAAGSAEVGIDPRTVVLADVNADGHLDVVIDDWYSSYGYGPISVGVYLG